ncbi:MAG TPA: crossover junction endodeoxyribonuclease RuvC [Spirochaetia bacterium]|nr:crossover junction endodeoxyribonuclease RuvC [Spirochaetia bacterium]
MVILGIDPGTTRIGYGLIKKEGNQYKSLSYGLINAEKISDSFERLEFIYQETLNLIQKTQPDLYSIEQLFFFKNSKTIISVSQARGVLLLAAKHSKIPIFECTPLQVKQGVTGYGKADKTQIAKMVQMLLKLPEIPKPDDITDALSIAITGGNFCKKIMA